GRPLPGHVAAEEQLDQEDDGDRGQDGERQPVAAEPEPRPPAVDDVLLPDAGVVDGEEARPRDEPPEDQVEQAPERKDAERRCDDRPADGQVGRFPQIDEGRRRTEHRHDRCRPAQRPPLVVQRPLLLRRRQPGWSHRVVRGTHLGSVDACSGNRVSLSGMHAHGHDHGAQGDRKLLIGALVLIAGLMAGEIATGVIAGSLALAFAVVAATLAARPAQGRWTYGFRRLEILSAQANGLMLALVGIWIVHGGIVLVVALAGIAVNIAATALLARASRESLNVRGAFVHVATDLLAFVGTAVAGLIVLRTGWDRADPIAGLVVAALMLWASFGLIRDSTRIFLETSPGDIDPEELARSILAVPDVHEVHDLHVWTLTSGFPVVSAHVLVAPGADCHGLRRQLEQLLADQYGLEHSTLQVEHAPGTLQLGPSYRRRAPLHR